MVERLITINLRRYLVEQPTTKRQRKAVAYVRERISHYTKVDIDNVRLDMKLSEQIIKYHARNMSPVKLKVDVKDGSAHAFIFSDKKEQPQTQINTTNVKKEKGKQQQNIPAAKKSDTRMDMPTATATPKKIKNE